MLGKGEVKMGEWMPINNEEFRTYVFPDGEITIDRPQKVMIKRKPEGDSHRIVALADDEKTPVSFYIPAGWIAIRWMGIDGTEEFGW